jgi:hypothetical protein
VLQQRISTSPTQPPPKAFASVAWHQRASASQTQSFAKLGLCSAVRRCPKHCSSFRVARAAPRFRISCLAADSFLFLQTQLLAKLARASRFAWLADRATHFSSIGLSQLFGSKELPLHRRSLAPPKLSHQLLGIRKLPFRRHSHSPSLGFAQHVSSFRVTRVSSPPRLRISCLAADSFLLLQTPWLAKLAKANRCVCLASRRFPTHFSSKVFSSCVWEQRASASQTQWLANIKPYCPQLIVLSRQEVSKSFHFCRISCLSSAPASQTQRFAKLQSFSPFGFRFTNVQRLAIPLGSPSPSIAPLVRFVQSLW